MCGCWDWWGDVYMLQFWHPFGLVWAVKDDLFSALQFRSP